MLMLWPEWEDSYNHHTRIILVIQLLNRAVLGRVCACHQVALICTYLAHI